MYRYEKDFIILVFDGCYGLQGTNQAGVVPVGTMAPDFTVTDSVTGKKLFSLSELRTQVTADR